MTDFTMTTDAEGVALITWDTPGKSMNVMSLDGFAQLDGFIDAALADDAVRGIVITSGKPGSFAGGMDLNIIAKMREEGGDDPAGAIFAGIMRIHAILRKIERAEDAVAVFLLHDAFGMAQMQRASDLLAHGEDVTVGVGLHAKDPQHAAHQHPHGADHR